MLLSRLCGPDVSRKTRECGPPDKPKQRHATRKEAEEHLWSLVHATGVRRHALEVYRCKWCKSYHVGHPPRRRYQK